MIRLFLKPICSLAHIGQGGKIWRESAGAVAVCVAEHTVRCSHATLTSFGTALPPFPCIPWTFKGNPEWVSGSTLLKRRVSQAKPAGEDVKQSLLPGCVFPCKNAPARPRAFLLIFHCFCSVVG